MKHLPATAMRSNGADYVRTYHHVAVDTTVTMDDLMRPAFWAHHAPALRPGDLVDVVSDILDVQFRVVEKGVGFVKMRPRLLWQDAKASAAVDADQPMPEIPDGYDVKRGPRGLWRVFVREPFLEVKGGIVTEVEARQVAAEHAAKALAALHMGADAVKAVEIAALLDDSTGGPVVTMKVKE